MNIAKTTLIAQITSFIVLIAYCYFTQKSVLMLTIILLMAYFMSGAFRFIIDHWRDS